VRRGLRFQHERQPDAVHRRTNHDLGIVHDQRPSTATASE